MTNIAKTKSSRYAWVVVSAGFLTQIMACMAVSIWGMNLSYIASDFQVSPSSLAIGASLFGLLYAGTSVFWGNLADKIGIRKVMTVGGIIGSILLVVAGFVSFGITGLIILYALSGLMLGAIGNGVTPKLVSTWFATHQRGKGFMLCIIGGSLGGVLMGVIAPILISSGGWRFCFEIIGVIGIACMILALIMIRDSPASIGTEPFGADKEHGDIISQKEIDADAQKASNRNRMLRVLKMPKMWIMTIVVILFQLYYTGHQTYFVAALVARGYDIGAAGLGASIVLTGCCIGYLIFSPLSDKFARKNVLGWLLVMSGVCYFAIYFLLQSSASITAVYVVSFASGLCLGAFALVQAVESELFAPDLRGAGPGMISTWSLIGRFGGPLLAAAGIGIFGGVSWGYMLIAAPCVLIAGILALAALPKTSGKYGDPMAEQYLKEKQLGSEDKTKLPK